MYECFGRAARLRWTSRNKISETARRMCECFWWAARLRWTGRKRTSERVQRTWAARLR